MIYVRLCAGRGIRHPTNAHRNARYCRACRAERNAAARREHMRRTREHEPPKRGGARKRGRPRMVPRVTPLTAQLIGETRRRGWTLAAIGADFGVSAQTVRRHLTRLGLS